MQPPSSIEAVIIGGIMGMIGGIVAIPFNLIASYFLKSDEQNRQHRFNMIEKKQELELSHRLQMAAKKDLEEEIKQIKIKLASIEVDVNSIKAKGV